MTATESAASAGEPVAQWWAYGGVRVLSGGPVLAWVTEAGDGEEVLFEPRRRGGRFTVGLLYPVPAAAAHQLARPDEQPRRAARTSPLPPPPSTWTSRPAARLNGSSTRNSRGPPPGITTVATH